MKRWEGWGEEGRGSEERWRTGIGRKWKRRRAGRKGWNLGDIWGTRENW